MQAVYFTATFPYVIMLVLLIRGVTLPGNEKGVTFFLTPQVHRLTEAKVWGDAVTQVLFSLSAGYGGVVTMSSYNKFDNNCELDAVIVAFVNCVSSLLSGFTVFSILGHMAHITNQDIGSVVRQGPGLAFIAYPEGIVEIPYSALWAFLFFFMFCTLGISGQFTQVQTVLSGISDIFPAFLRPHKSAFTAFCCLLGFLLGLPMVTKGGIYMLTLMDWYSSSYNLMIATLAEIICLMYVYGVKQFMEDIKMMIGHRPNPYWLVSWVFLTPVLMLFVIIVSATQYVPASYGDYRFPPWAQGIGWCMVVAPVAMLLLLLAAQTYKLGPRKAFVPSTSWGPAKQEHRTGRYSVSTALADSLGYPVGTSAASNGGFRSTEESDQYGFGSPVYYVATSVASNGLRSTEESGQCGSGSPGYPVATSVASNGLRSTEESGQCGSDNPVYLVATSVASNGLRSTEECGQYGFDNPVTLQLETR